MLLATKVPCLNRRRRDFTVARLPRRSLTSLDRPLTPTRRRVLHLRRCHLPPRSHRLRRARGECPNEPPDEPRRPREPAALFQTPRAERPFRAPRARLTASSFPKRAGGAHDQVDPQHQHPHPHRLLSHGHRYVARAHPSSIDRFFLAKLADHMADRAPPLP